MAKAQALIKFTHEDYKSLPESETKRYELLEGELVMTPSPTWRHQDILLRLVYRLQGFVDTRKLGTVGVAPLDVVLSTADVVQPDILFIAREHLSIVHEEEIRGAPDLLIEILSPATAQRDRTYKRTLYARHGVAEYWLVDPDAQTIEVLALGERGYRRAGVYGPDQTLKSALLTGLSLPLSEIFLR